MEWEEITLCTVTSHLNSSFSHSSVCCQESSFSCSDLVSQLNPVSCAPIYFPFLPLRAFHPPLESDKVLSAHLKLLSLRPDLAFSFILSCHCPFHLFDRRLCPRHERSMIFNRAFPFPYQNNSSRRQARHRAQYLEPFKTPLNLIWHASPSHLFGGKKCIPPRPIWAAVGGRQFHVRAVAFLSPFHVGTWRPSVMRHSATLPASSIPSSALSK